ncbi:MAG: hypothetical protein RLZZ511_4282 [Cyanobacteriota bacterium]|jgi:hypothetical protein
MAETKPKEPTAETTAETTAEPKPKAKKERRYRPLVNWRYGKLYREGKEYDLEGIPQEDIDSAIEQGHLEVC